MKRLDAFVLLLILAIVAASAQASPERLGFTEVWAYLMDGEERFLTADLPITDVAYFGAGMNSHGKLVGVPDRQRIKYFKARAHYVVAEVGNFALTHFCLDPAFRLRDALVADIIKGAESFDGVQIDFEAVGAGDQENFCAFLALLKGGLGGKSLSVALPARSSEDTDHYGYQRIGKIADRVIAMAYDEHWSQSEPGPVASIQWCKKAADYAVSKMDSAKLVMGLPFYGRAWADKSLSRAYKYSSLETLRGEKGIASIERVERIPHLEYSEIVNVKVFFDDLESTMARMMMYRASSVRNIAFWRLGQEDPLVWSGIAIAPSPEANPLAF